MPRTAIINHNDANEIVVNFDPDAPDDAWHVIFTLDEAEDFARTILRRVDQVREFLAGQTPC